MIESLIQISAPTFTAGLMLRNDIVTEAAPIIRYMARGKWTSTRVREYCRTRDWDVTVIYQLRSDDGWC